MSDSRTVNPEQLAIIIERARSVAADYYLTMGRPLGITGEIGEYDAVRLLGMTLAAARTAGYDAVKQDGTKVQIKTRYLCEDIENRRRVPTIKMTHSWDTTILVLLDKNFNTRAIYEAQRDAISTEISKLSDKAKARGAIGLRTFKKIAKQIWPLNHITS
ncbi:MAG: hypothetical protein EB059_03180 [Alphaproteobacteria bacterium]|nr:hypothetical protein [Alphaproteobacteria bacterium]